MRYPFVFLIFGLFSGSAVFAQEPQLPSGLSSDPALPAGLGERMSEPKRQVSSIPTVFNSLDIMGFSEARYGHRLQNDKTQMQHSLGEARIHSEMIVGLGSRTTATLAGDLIYDSVMDGHSLDIESGDGFLDLREANIVFRATDFSDVKAGRQILTWGTGDLLFINDLFPKDWNSFFIGRDEEYLKAPSDAVKVALYSDFINMDVVYTPRFDSDRYIDGRRISYYNAGYDNVVGIRQPVRVESRSHWFSDDEVAVRLHRLVGSYEAAAYFYQGYWKSPAGQNALTGRYTFPRLGVYGGSIRGPIGQGIISSEVGYYDSLDNKEGTNPLINNSEWRFLVGYEQEVRSELTANLQYYHEWLQKYSDYQANLVAGTKARDEHRHLITLRLTQLMMNQNLSLSLFTFYSPTDRDMYFRPNATYKFDDHWIGSVGGNLFEGKQSHTFFGQFEDNSNAYMSLRYGF